MSTPPAWKLADNCSKCKLLFSVLVRSESRHHCRNCGGSFCGVCSSLKLALPHYGFEKPERVCRACFESLTVPPHLKNQMKAEAEAEAKAAAAAAATAAAPAKK